MMAAQPGCLRSFKGLAAMVALCALVSAGARAQYYDEREYQPLRVRYIYAGAMQRDFAPRSSNQAADSATIRYARLMPMIGFRQGPVEFFFGYTSFKQRGATNSAIFLGTAVTTEFPLSGKRSNALILPLVFAADFTKAESGGPERENFNIASVGLGAGLKYRLTSDGVDFSVHAEELVHYSLEGLSTGSGFSAATLADVSLVLRDIALLDGLALGYRFRYQTWSMTDSKFDYRVTSHGPYLGILF